MPDDHSTTQSNLRVLYPQTTRARRRRLLHPIRHVMIAILGALVGLLAFYLLKKIGY